MHATAVDNENFHLTNTRGLKWYRASAVAARGFCCECGSVLFWKPDKGRHTSFTCGSIDGATGLKVEGHIYCDYKGDYYEIPDEGYRRGEWES